MVERRTVRRARVLLLACLAVAMVLPGAGAALAQEPGGGVPVGGVEGVPIPALTWEPCGEAGAECTTATVPRNYLDLSDGTLELAIARRPADDQAGKIGSLFVNFGGPGGPAVPAIMSGGVFPLFPDEVLARFDVIGVDPRGVGASTPVTCWSSERELAIWRAGQPSFPVTRAEEALVAVKNRTYAQRCEERNGDLLEHVSTAAFARDLDVLREAVGDDELTYFGLSYGTDLGAVYANLFPERARALVLDGVLDPVDFNEGPRGTISSARIESDEGAYATLLEFLRLCGENAPACPFADGSDLLGKYDELARRLQDQPVTLVDPEGGRVRVDYAAMVNFTRGTLYDAPAFPLLGAVLQELWVATESAAPEDAGGAYARLRERFEDARSEIQAARGFQVEGGVQGPEGFDAVACAETDNPRANQFRWGTVGRQRDAVAPYFGRAWTWATGACAFWPAVAVDQYDGPWTAVTANPVLVVGSLFDPSTNYTSAVKLDGLLPNSALLTLDGYGHTARGSSCIDAALARYLVDLTTPAPGTVCRQDLGPFDPIPAAQADEAAAGSAAALRAAIASGAAPPRD
jgi:pimeloyl-ACP methyl ester carboxylesterase